MSSEDENPRDRGRRLRAELTHEERKLWVSSELESVLQVFVHNSESRAAAAR